MKYKPRYSVHIRSDREGIIVLHIVQQKICFDKEELNPIWTGLFAYLKTLGGGGQNTPVTNLAVSTLMTMKLGRDILWVKTLQIDEKF